MLCCKMKCFKASDLFDLKINGDFPLDCQFVPKSSNTPALEKPGIYMLFFDREIVYVGLADKEPALGRIQMQLSTITLRGKNIFFNSSSRIEVGNSTTLNTVFKLQTLNQNANGPETSANRVKFAASKWDLFSRLNQDILSRFVICWFPENDCFTETLQETKNQFINEIKPCCNS